MKSINLKTVSVALIEGVEYVMIEGLCLNETGNVELRRADNLAERQFLPAVVFSQRVLPLTLEHDNKQYAMADATNVVLHGNHTTAKLLFTYEGEQVRLRLANTTVVGIEGTVTETVASEETQTDTVTETTDLEETSVVEEQSTVESSDMFYDTALKVLEDKLGLSADEVDTIIAAGEGNEAIIDKLLKRCLSEEKDEAEESHIEGLLLDMGDRLGFKLSTETSLEDFKKSIEFLKGFKVDTLPEDILAKVQAPLEIFSRFVGVEINTLGNLLDMIEERLGLDVDDLYNLYQQELSIEDVLAKLPVMDNNDSDIVETSEEPVADTDSAETESTQPTIITNEMIGRGKKNKRNK